jgi:hypothetical protein
MLLPFMKRRGTFLYDNKISDDPIQATQMLRFSPVELLHKKWKQLHGSHFAAKCCSNLLKSATEKSFDGQVRHPPSPQD